MLIVVRAFGELFNTAQSHIINGNIFSKFYDWVLMVDSHLKPLQKFYTILGSRDDMTSVYNDTKIVHFLYIRKLCSSTVRFVPISTLVT